MKVIETNSEYQIIEDYFNGIAITFRQWHHNRVIEIKFDDNFARSNGFRDKQDMLRGNAKNQLISTCGCIPEWIVCGEQGFILTPMN